MNCGGYAQAHQASTDTPVASASQVTLFTATFGAPTRQAPAPARRLHDCGDHPVTRIYGDNTEESSYEQEIVCYMIISDNETKSNPEAMNSQPEIRWSMRPFLLDFLIDIQIHFRLRPEVLYLAMNLVDRYISRSIVYTKQYQLVGCAALWTAAKFEESKDRVPLVKELSNMCCGAYEESEFVSVEGHVLTTVGWILCHPTAEAWLRLFIKEVRVDQKTQDVTRFIMELTLYHREHAGMLSYDIAIGALLLARFICGIPHRTDLPSLRAPIFDNGCRERAHRVVFALDQKLREFDINVSDILYRKYMPGHFSRASHICKEWYSNPANHFTDAIELANDFGCTGSQLAGELRRDYRRESWMFGSSSSSVSSSSSEDGEGVLTPNTPNVQIRSSIRHGHC